MSTRHYRKAAALALVASVGLSVAACSSSSKNDAGANGKTTIVVDCAPPKTQNNGQDLVRWNNDIAAFEKIHTDVVIRSESVGTQCDNPPDFTARLQGGTEADVYYGYFTDTNQVLDLDQAADISSYINSSTVPNWSSVQQTWKTPFADGGKQYGIPTNNYTMGLVINKKLFTQAGLDPTKPPQTWAEVAADAKKISALGNGIYGYSDYSANHTGGWHFTAELYSLGGELTTADGKKADFNNAMGQQVLQNLYNMRWNDNSVGQKQLLQWGDLLTNAGAGKVGMYIGAPDSITSIVTTFKGNYSDWAMGPMPGADGYGKAALAGGNGYFFRKGDTAAQIKAGLEWISYEFLTPGQGQFDYKAMASEKLAVGLPEPQLFTAGSAADTQAGKLAKQYETVNPADYATYISNPITPKGEPANAQPLYAVLDGPMSTVLTQHNANIPQLLGTAEKQVNQVLSTPTS